MCPVSGDHTGGRVADDPSFFLSRWQRRLTADTEVSCVDVSIFEALVKLLSSRSERGRPDYSEEPRVPVHLHTPLFAYGELGNKSPLMYFTVAAELPPDI